jgi:hypothetical protein
MKIEILENEFVKLSKEEISKVREVLSNTVIDFSSINKLKGEKTLLEKAFQDEKTESLNK